MESSSAALAGVLRSGRLHRPKTPAPWYHSGGATSWGRAVRVSERVTTRSRDGTASIAHSSISVEREMPSGVLNPSWTSS